MSVIAFLPSSAVILLFFVLHLIVGALQPYKAGRRPFLWSLMETAGREMDRRLNRAGRGKSALFVRGMITAIIMGAFGFLIGLAVDRIGEYRYGWLASLVFLFLCVSAMSPLKVMREVIEALNKKDNKRAAAAVQPYFREDFTKADGHTFARRALELSAWWLLQYLVAPSLFFIFFDAIGLSLYVTFLALFDAFGRTDLRHDAFSAPVRLIEKIYDIVPALITGILTMIASLFVSRSNPFRSLNIALSQASREKVWCRGFVRAAVAGGLGVTLGGPVRDDADHVINNGWIGSEGSSAKVTALDVQRGAMLHFVIFVCFIITISGFFYVTYLHNELIPF